MLTKVVVFCAVLGVALAWTAQGFSDPKPEKFSQIEGCYRKSDDKVQPPGRHPLPPPECAEMACDASSGAYSLYGCGAVSGPNVKPGDKTKPYPECCNRLH